jgi:hypothetical protein
MVLRACALAIFFIIPPPPPVRVFVRMETIEIAPNFMEIKYYLYIYIISFFFLFLEIEKIEIELI